MTTTLRPGDLTTKAPTEAKVIPFTYDGLGASAEIVTSTITVTPIHTPRSYADAVLALAPRVYWRLNEASGLTLVDSSGHANDLTLASATGITYGVTGAIGDASHGLALSGTQAEVEPDQDVPLFDGRAHTLIIWARPGLVGAADYGLFCTDIANYNHLIYLAGEATPEVPGIAAGKVRFSYQYFNGSSYVDHVGETDITPGDLHMWALVLDASGNGQWYLDGVTDGDAFTLIGAIPTSIDTLFADGVANAGLVATLCDEIAITDTALTATQIAALYAHRTDTETGLLVDNLAIDADGQGTSARLSEGTRGQAYEVRNDVTTDETPAQTFSAAITVLIE